MNALGHMTRQGNGGTTHTHMKNHVTYMTESRHMYERVTHANEACCPYE